MASDGQPKPVSLPIEQGASLGFATETHAARLGSDCSTNDESRTKVLLGSRHRPSTFLTMKFLIGPGPLEEANDNNMMLRGSLSGRECDVSTPAAAVLDTQLPMS